MYRHFFKRFFDIIVGLIALPFVLLFIKLSDDDAAYVTETFTEALGRVRYKQTLMFVKVNIM